MTEERRPVYLHGSALVGSETVVNWDAVTAHDPLTQGEQCWEVHATQWLPEETRIITVVFVEPGTPTVTITAKIMTAIAEALTP